MSTFTLSRLIIKVKVNLNKKKVVVGISGGVDSAMCLKILLAQGFDVVAVYVKMCRYKGGLEKDIRSAKIVAKTLGVKLEIIDAGSLFCKKVVSYYDKQIKKGNTPSPCVLCNPEVKLATLLEYADKVGAFYIATGHYATIKEDKSGIFQLKKAKDKTKDQTYSLCFLTQRHLSRMLLPLGEFNKNNILQMAKRIKGLQYLSRRKESQDFCYLGKVDQISYCKMKFPKNKGEVVDKSGKIIGYHDGIYSFTIGQRRGIGLSGGPYYVISKDAKNNKIIVSTDKRDLLENRIELGEYHPIGPMINNGMTVSVKLRSSQKCGRAKIEIKKQSLVLNFDVPQRAITPGQIAVLYKGNNCLGGGVIKG